MTTTIRSIMKSMTIKISRCAGRSASRNGGLGRWIAGIALVTVLALVVFGILLAGRYFRGWRGKQAVYLYLGGFALLCLAYFGSRVILEGMLDRSWG